MGFPYKAVLKRWLALSLGGWLAYVLARGLWTVVTLGMPFFDWQWYLAGLLLVLSLPVRILFRLRRGRAVTFILTLLTAWLMLGYNGFGHTIRLKVESQPAIPISF